MANTTTIPTNYTNHIMYPSSSGTTFGSYTDITLPKKYYDIYDYAATNTTHNRGHIGDATKETLVTYGNTSGGWYSDYAYFPNSTNPWVPRGGYHTSGSSAGAFSFSNSDGGVSVYSSARSALAMTS